MVSYQLLIFGTALVVGGFIFGVLNDTFFELTTSGIIGYTGTNSWFIMGQGWMDFIFTLVPTVILVSGGIYLIARAMKG